MHIFQQKYFAVQIGQHSIHLPLFSQSLTPLAQVFEWVEFFAGHARATLAMRAAGFRCARLDLNYFPKGLDCGYGSNYFDILSTSGFACKA